MEDILTSEQVAKILQVHPFTVLKFIKQGKLKASKLGRVYRIRRSDVDEFLDSSMERDMSKESSKKSKKTVVKEEKEKKTEKSSRKREKKEEIGPPLEVPTKEISVEKESQQRSNTNDLDHYVLELKS